MSLHHAMRSAVNTLNADPDYENVSLLLLGNGTNGGQNNTFTDGSSNAFSITRYGNTTQGTFSPFGYNWSNYFDGSGDYLTLGGQSDFAFGTGDFTVECWVFPQNNAAVIYDSRPASTNGNYLMVAINSSNQLEVVVNNSVILAAGSIAANSWSHIAVTRSGTSLRGFVNGSQVGSTITSSTDFLNGTARPIIGTNGYTTTANSFSGIISNLRVLKGTAQYTGSYTVPAAPLTAITNTSLLTCQSNRFIDNSSNAFTITPYGDAKVTNFAPFPTNTEYSTGTNGGSGYFDGTGDYLSLPSNTAFNIGTGNFTIEFWIYRLNSNFSLFKFYDASTSNGIDAESTDKIEWWKDGIGAILKSTTTIYSSTWYHIAFVRSGTSFKLYVNGSEEASTTNSDSFDFSSWDIGRGYYQNLFNGYLSSFRILKNTAQYTANFTPSTTPLTSITNTSLLLNFTNGSIIDSTGKNDLETVGDAQISTATKKFGTGSLKFDGTGDRLYIPATSLFGFGTGDYTVEFWFYLAAMPSSGSKFTVMDFRSTDTATPHTIYVNSSGYLGFFNGSSDVTSASNSLSSSTWYHIAYCRSSGTLKIFVDGSQAYSAANSSDYHSSKNLWIGGAVGAVEYLNGYIDDLRISKVARYTAAFTPPSRQLPAR